jgi:hypothetical protein
MRPGMTRPDRYAGPPETRKRPATLRDAALPVKACEVAGGTTDLTLYFDAVVLFSVFTTWTRRFTSASGWLGSFSLLLP